MSAPAPVNSGASRAQSLRTCYVRSDADGMLGLHLSRAPWDPYPWISSVQSGSSAAAAGIRVGDCVLEVNGTDVLGQRIAEVAERIRSKWRPARISTEKGVTFLLWNAKTENNLNPNSLQKFTTCLQSVAQLLECPVCLDVVRPPAWQCCHGHVLCGSCRDRSQRCPVCRVSFSPRGRCLIADKLFTLLAETFPCENKETGHKICTATAPCSPTISQSTTTSTSPNQIVISKATSPTVLIPKAGQSSSTLHMHCPHASAGKTVNCPRLSSTHELLTHLQRVHKTTITQYYCNLGDRLTVRFTDHSISALAIPKNGQLELFLVLRRPDGPDHGGGAAAAAAVRCSSVLCWLWYVGAEEVAAAYDVRMEYGERNMWHGSVRSLDAGSGRAADIWKSAGCARIDTVAANVVVEITKKGSYDDNH